MSRHVSCGCPDTLPAGAPTGVAAWHCEILSPSTAGLDRGRKLAIYAREGISHCWLIDPLAHTLEVLRLESGRWVILATHVGREPVRAEPFAAIELPVGELWADQ